jgi:Asp-tRNA(Asn)/Glu-tRNA(Gln) amidotransferase A subunit family amidase
MNNAAFPSIRQPLAEYLAALGELIAGSEPEVLALLPEDGRFERLQRKAASLLRAYPDPEDRPPLFGVPVGVKDIFRVDGFLTRAGSKLPPELFAGPEASCVTALRAAGALVLGKTVTTEFAYFAPGPTRHPLSAKLGEVRTPGGSSSGSAAAVAAGFVSLALGTQTIGSVIRPAAFCGVAGFKPSYGRVQAGGVIPLAPAVDTVGWFTRTVAEAAWTASVLIPDWEDTRYEIRNTKYEIRNTSLEGVVLGVPEGPYLERASAEGLAHFRSVERRLVATGYEVRPVAAMADFDDIQTRHNVLVAYEAAQVHADWFERYGDAYHPKTAELIRRGQAVSDAVYRDALNGRARLRQEMHFLMEQHGIDLWIAPPAIGPAPVGLESTGDPVMALPWTHAGMPALALPAGTNAAGWPMGLQVVGRFGEDEELLAMCALLEEPVE